MATALDDPEAIPRQVTASFETRRGVQQHNLRRASKSLHGVGELEDGGSYQQQQAAKSSALAASGDGGVMQQRRQEDLIMLKEIQKQNA